MRVLDLFAGLGGWGSAFEERGHDVVSIDFDERFEVTLRADIFDVTPATLEAFGRFDVVLASPPCERFSVLQIGRNWTPPPDNQPKTPQAARALELVRHTRALIEALDPAFFVVENPVGKLRRLDALAGLERRSVTYCQYGAPWRKPTDLWGGFPPSLELRASCRNGDPCHIAAPRGSRTAVQGGRDLFGGFRERGDYLRNLTSNRRLHRELAKGAGMRSSDVSAFRALVPEQLSLAVCIAAEHDIEAGLTWRDGSAGRLFA